jgi:uncharacterized membrane protein
LERWLLLGAVITSGLSAGLFFAFAYAVMPGLAKAGDQTLVTAMQGINVAIINPLFLLVYLGPLAFGLATVVALLGAGKGDVFGWTIAGLAVYVLGVIVVTAAINIPLNNALDAAGDADHAATRRAFESPWNRANVLRTVASAAAFGCFAWAALLSPVW